MKKKLMIQVVLTALFWAHVALAGGAESKISDLTPWLGQSVSIINLYQGKSAEKYYAAVAEHAPKGYTPDLVRKFIHNQFSLKFETFEVVDKDTIVIDNKISGKYRYVGQFSTSWKGTPAKWEIFKTSSEEMIKAGFKHFLFFPFHQHGKDSLRHAHLRYGNEGFDYLITDPSVQMWWPTIYQPETTDEAKIIASMIKGAKLQASILPPLNRPVKDVSVKRESE